MAEFMGKKQEEMRAQDAARPAGFDAFGHPVPYYRREEALKHCRQMGLTDTGNAMTTIDRMSNAIERDEPYQAMEAGMAYLDLIGTYRLMAVLCTAEKKDG